jgi:hypothetical protein
MVERRSLHAALRALVETTEGSHAIALPEDGGGKIIVEGRLMDVPTRGLETVRGFF